MDPQLVSRARGALLGLVAGNQLGVPTEHLATAEAIRKAFPNGVRDLAPPPKNSPYDDDAAMALLLGESLLSTTSFDAGDVARRWVRWMKVDGRGIGLTTKRALTLIDRGKEPFEAGRLTQQENPGGSAGHGSVMRCIPGALRYPHEPERLVRVSTQQAAITQADERCTWGAAALTLAARELLLDNIYFIHVGLHWIVGRSRRARRGRCAPRSTACRANPKAICRSTGPARPATSSTAWKSHSGLRRMIARSRRPSSCSPKRGAIRIRMPRRRARCWAPGTGRRRCRRAGSTSWLERRGSLSWRKSSWAGRREPCANHAYGARLGGFGT